MSTTTQAAAEIQALTEKLVLAQKELDKAKDATKAVTESTKFYSTALHAAALVQEQEATAAAHKAASALAEFQEVTKGATTDTKELSRLFAKAFGEEVPEKIGDTKKAFAAFGDASLTSSQRAQGLFAGIGLGASAVRAGAMGMLAYAEQVIALGHASLEAGVRLQALEERQRAMAGSMGEVSRATGGAGSEADAYAARLALLNANLDTNAHSVAQVLEFARQHRRAGEENSESINRVVAAVQGNSGAQAELNLHIRAGSTALEAQAQAMQQMTAANQAAGPAAQTAAEQLARTEQGWSRFKDGFVSVLGTWLQVRGIYTGFSDFANGVTESQSAIAQAWNFSTEAAERAGERAAVAAGAEVARRRELQRAEQTQIQARGETLRGLHEEYDARKTIAAVDAGVLEGRVLLIDAQQAYNRRLVEQSTLSQRFREEDSSYAQRQLDAQGRVTAARQHLLQLQQQEIQQRRAHDDLGVQAALLRSHGMQVSSQVHSVSVQQQYNNLLREARDLKRSELETQEAFDARAAQTLQAASAARQAQLQRMQGAQATADAREGLARTLGEMTRLNIPGAAVGLGNARELQVRGLTQQQVDQQTREMPFHLRRRAWENEAEFINRANTAAAAYLQYMTRIIEQERERVRLQEQRADERNGGILAAGRDTMRGLENARETPNNAALFERIRQSEQTGLEITQGGSEAGLIHRMQMLEKMSMEGRMFAEQHRDALTGAYDEAGRAALRNIEALAGEHNALQQARNGWREFAAAQREANDVGLQFAQSWVPAAERSRTAAQKMASFSVSAFQSFSGALTQHVIAAIEGRENFGEAMRGMAHDTSSAIMQAALPQALWEGAMAIASVARGIGGDVKAFAEAGAHATAAAAFGALAAAGGIVAGLTTAPSAGAGGAAAAASNGGPPARGSDASTQHAAAGGPVVYNFNGLLTMRDAERQVIGLLDNAHRTGSRPISQGS